MSRYTHSLGSCAPTSSHLRSLGRTVAAVRRWGEYLPDGAYDSASRYIVSLGSCEGTSGHQRTPTVVRVVTWRWGEFLPEAPIQQ